MDSSTLDKISELGDLDLALLVSRVAEQHCIFSAAVESIKNLQEELRLSCIDTFGIQPAVVECSPQTTVDEFNSSLLVPFNNGSKEAADRHHLLNLPTFEVDYSPSRDHSPRRFGSIANGIEDLCIAEIIIATRLDTADECVQVQALELLTSRRIFTRSSMHVAPKNLLFIAISSSSAPQAKLSRHLNDVFCMSHFHAAEDALPHTEENNRREKWFPPTFDAEEIQYLQDLTKTVHMTAEIAQYLHNVVVFLRNSRFVQAGVTATATRQLRSLSLALAPLHGLTYVPPSIVALAARKIYRHRLVLATPKTERSLLWGSHPEAVRLLLEGVTVEDVIEDVLAGLETPL
ncbi:uncharacterized protein RCC_09189 [Ramularia collo-cygni]|uniref:Magnesium chelatase n=1 Tax=Ramularia collo-cygni TaxID=112498 RepID=A0A2D3VCN1_9PEZI|nr:uncharacterized protein RCC_09189 [Ramularia collo-cygni]CZT23475.1 uncharacterized protein RCC_09189 [Ramularia collo-cygni]